VGTGTQTGGDLVVKRGGLGRGEDRRPEKVKRSAPGPKKTDVGKVWGGDRNEGMRTEHCRRH